MNETEELRKLWNTVIKPEEWISSGSRLLNLACSGLPDGCFFAGGYFWFVGDSSSGKTMVSLKALAEASINKYFDDYDLIFDNVERGALMDIEEFFGPKLADRLEPPRMVGGVPKFSEKVEEVYFNLHQRLDAVESGKGKRFIYLVDSIDATTSEYEIEKFLENEKAFRKDEEAVGDYGDGKAKIHSRWIRNMTFRLVKNKCTAIFLSQTRDNIGGERWEPDTVAAGGRALKFYAAFQLWSSLGRKLTKTVNGNDRQIGVISKIAVKKNRLTGKEWSVEVPIYWSSGVDDLGSQIDFLIDEKYWKEKDGKLTAPDFEFEGKKITLLRKIESENLESKLLDIVVKVWREIEEKCRVERKNPYH